MENQSNDYVQIRFESSKVLDAKDQADHDTRTKIHHTLETNMHIIKSQIQSMYGMKIMQFKHSI